MNSQEALHIVEAVLNESRLSRLQKTVFCHTWEDKSYLEIAHSCGYELGYVKQTGSQLWKLLSHALNERVTKHNLQLVLKRKAAAIAQPAPEEVEPFPPLRPPSPEQRQTIATLEAVFSAPTVPQPRADRCSPDPPKADWGDAVEAPAFVGRTSELSQFETWIQGDRCRLLGLFGMGGIGKTSLAARLARNLMADGGGRRLEQGRQTADSHGGAIELQTHSPKSFQYLIWRSLRNAPPLSDLLTDLMQFLSDQQETGLPETLDGQLRRLLDYLRRHRCLLVLDNAETIMQHGHLGGAYLPGYEGYGQLWRCLGESNHISTAILTSREKPREIVMMEGDQLPVRSHQLRGLSAKDGQEIFQVKGTFQGSDEQWQTLIDHYAGNPLALKMVAPVIQDLFAGDISEFIACLQAGTSIFGDIQDLLEQQVSRLSALEQDLLFWLAIARKPLSFSDLRANLVPSIPLGRLIEAMSALERRYLIEKASLHRPERSHAYFTLQPAVMEYATERLIHQAFEGLSRLLNPPRMGRQPTGEPQPVTLLQTHALIQAQAKDYIRETQLRLILKPLGDRLLSAMGETLLQDTLHRFLDVLRGQTAQQVGYLAGNLLNLLAQIGVDLTGWNFSHLPIWNAYLRDTPLHRVNFTGAAFARSAFKETFSQVLSVAFSPDGRLLATGDVNHEIHIWQVSEGKPLMKCRVDEGWVWSVAFSPDGRFLASSANRMVKLWDVQTGDCVRTFAGYSDRVFSVAFSPDGQLLATGSEDHLVRVWAVKTGHLLSVFEGHLDEVRSVAFSPDPFKGLLLASASFDGMVRLWDVQQGTCLKVLHGHHDRVWSVAFSLDGQTLASGGSDRTVKLWQVNTGGLLRSLDHAQPIRAVAFNGDGRSLASGSDDGVLRLWDYHTGEGLKVMTGHTSWISSLAFNPAQPMLASGSEDQSVRFWDSQTGLCLKTFQGYSDGVWSVAFHPQGHLLASGSQDRIIRLWDPETGTLLQSFRGHSSWVWSVAFSPTDALLASGSEDRTIHLWDLSSGHLLQSLEGHRDAVLSVLFTPDGRSLISSSLDGTIKIWEVATGREKRTLQGHTGGIWCTDLSPDGRWLVTGSQDQTLRLWDMTTCECLHRLEGPQSWIRCVAISPDQRHILSGSADGRITVWRLQDGRCEHTVAAHTGPVLSAVFHPDSTHFVSSSTDTSIKLWDAFTWETIQVLDGHHRWVRSLAYSPNGRLLASSSQDETIKLWTVAPPSRAIAQDCQTLRIPRPYEGMVIHQATGLTSAQASALKLLGAIAEPR